ncbi:DUF4350 domain-containing protein [Natronolimnobius sp. AArcel1]|uniref:DUF4350 domain-containing protein n=1 Tax=Natronolimnobius sp. AArcel1 TaxID=1679093 RepID=UPI0013EA443F|nr:DUF4350 domain-containing protein [Natronolimnobius sp. AArcel1]NGM70755.1 DUF4350 domain-containing protein [Natronolimnobius sp. AArcel1]
MNPLEWFQDTSSRTGIDWPRVLLASLVIVVCLGFGIAAATSTAAFGPFNPSWDGMSELHDQINDEPGVESDLIRETTQYTDHQSNETVAFVVAPDEPYTGADLERLEQFVADGGTLVVFENFDTPGNDLLADVGASAHADGELLRDHQNYYQGPSMPIATGITDHTYTEGVDQLTLNYAASIEPNNATVLVETSDAAYRDLNRDGELSDGEEPGAYPVATVEPVSSGQVIAVSDPSIAINAMIDEPDNEAFLRAIYTDADQVLIDLSHADELPPLASATLTLRESPLLQLFLGGIGIGMIAVGARSSHRLKMTATRLRSRLTSGHPQDTRGTSTDEADLPTLEDEQRATHLRERHPDWDEERISRVITALNRTGSKRRDDE